MFAVPQVTPGEVYFYPATPADVNWTVPEGVYSICAVVQQKHGSAAAVGLSVGGVVVLRAVNGGRIGDGGGDGGAAGASGPKGGGRGGGGAGGYTGNGGAGGGWSAGGGREQGLGGAAGVGGAGGGGGGETVVYGEYPAPDTYWTSAAGGGVGLMGVGVSGSGGGGAYSAFGAYPGGDGSPDARYGVAGMQRQVSGGALAWKNDIPVSPGQVLKLQFGATYNRIRIFWGGGRSFPYNAGYL